MTAQALHHRNVADAETENEPAAVERVQRDHGAVRRKGIAPHKYWRSNCRSPASRCSTATRTPATSIRSPAIPGTTGSSSHYSRPCARNAQLRPVEFIGVVPHAKASKLHVDCIRVEGTCEPLSRGQKSEAVRMSEIASRRRSAATYPNAPDPARPPVSRARLS